MVDIIFPATCSTASEIIAIKNYVKNELNLIPRILFEQETTPTKKENSENEFPSYSPEKRFKQFYEALKNKDSKIVWCARGGYGSGDILPFLDKAKKIKQSKIFTPNGRCNINFFYLITIIFLKTYNIIRKSIPHLIVFWE